jgi:excisionase family DNA binding protein
MSGAGHKSNLFEQTGQQAWATTEGSVPFSQRLTCTIDEACSATGLGRTKLYELIGAGSLATTTIGRRRLVSVDSLRALLAPRNVGG